MATNYTKHPVTGDGDATFTSQMTYDGPALAASGSSSGDDINDILERMDAAIVASTPISTLDSSDITVTGVTFGTEIPSATDLEDFIDQLNVVVDSNADKYTQSETDAKVGHNGITATITAGSPYTINFATLSDKRNYYHLTGSGAGAYSVVASNEADGDFVELMIYVASPTSITVMGETIDSQLFGGYINVFAYYATSAWKVTARPNFLDTSIILSSQVKDFATDVAAVSSVATAISSAAASKIITDYLTVTGATDLDAIRVKAGFTTVTQAVDLDAMESKLAGIEAAADVTDATNVAAAGAPLLSTSNVFTNDNDFSAGTVTVATPVNDTDPASKGYVDARYFIYQRSFTLTADQISTLHSSGITLIAAGGASTVIEVISVSAFLDYESAAYDGTGNLLVKYNSGSTIWTFANAFVKSGDDTYNSGTPSAGINTSDNTAVELSASAALYSAAGDSPIVLSVAYRIVDFS